jgi:hypothetical protein
MFWASRVGISRCWCWSRRTCRATGRNKPSIVMQMQCYQMKILKTYARIARALHSCFSLFTASSLLWWETPGADIKKLQLATTTSSTSSTSLACCTSFREIPRRIKKQTHVAAAVPNHRIGIELLFSIFFGWRFCVLPVFDWPLYTSFFWCMRIVEIQNHPQWRGSQFLTLLVQKSLWTSRKKKKSLWTVTFLGLVDGNLLRSDPIGDSCTALGSPVTSSTIILFLWHNKADETQERERFHGAWC